ncbi:PspC domain-containing protein [Methanoplanus endosymbiosus]|uniref:PspC domain-containing protein n=1 Tax=Methanoplanus endosymbiosus TaxID=33865 RepID=A0A9E7PM53_9EURY|nr:PspC domain-containing protein [Methanoplanus endosymbiosus]UUX92703.1 PspC domain-containing protein [Methanoplanus endosymbiosus]
MNKIYRTKDDRILAGVCSGIGRGLDIDPNIVRIVFVVMTLAYGAGIIAYIAGWVLLPDEEENDVIDAEFTIKN